MDSQRAKEIISSPVMVDVVYNDANVYMEDVNEADQTCTVHYLNQPENKLDVPLMSLKEHVTH